MSQKLRVAVTGGSGRVGTHVVKVLLERGHEVVVLDRRQPRVPGVRFVYADTRSRENVQRGLEGVDAVCHLGEIPHAHGAQPPEEIYASNCASGAVVFQAAADLKLRALAYASTCQVYGMWAEDPPYRTAPLALPMTESQPFRPANVYASSKVANEHLAHQITLAHGLPITILRLPWTLSQKIDETWFEWLENEKAPFLDGLGTYVEGHDAGVAFALAIEKALPGCDAYHLAADEVVAKRPIGEELRHRCPGVPALPVDWPEHRSPVSTEKIRAALGWTPTFNLMEQYRRWKAARAG